MTPLTMKLALVLSLVSSCTPWYVHDVSQAPFKPTDELVSPEAAGRVRGMNNATYGPAAEEDQLLSIEFLEIAPSPFLVNQVVFVWLRCGFGTFYTEGSSGISDADLEAAVLKITASAEYSNGESDEPVTYKIPLQTMAYNSQAHLAIRNDSGAHVDYLSASGANDILLDMWLWSDWIRAGDWAFAIATELEDGRNLFTLTLTQYLEGNLRTP